MQKKSAAFLLWLIIVCVVGLVGLSIWRMKAVQAKINNTYQTLNETFPIHYEVSGLAKEVYLTIATPGGTEQQSVSLPYKSQIYRFKRSSLTYISAKIKEGDGNVTVSILMGVAGGGRDTTKNWGSCEGQGSIASASYFIPLEVKINS